MVIKLVGSNVMTIEKLYCINSFFLIIIIIIPKYITLQKIGNLIAHFNGGTVVVPFFKTNIGTAVKNCHLNWQLNWDDGFLAIAALVRIRK